MKVLFLTRYPVQGASSRYRVYQYLPHLEALGVTCTVSPFMSPRLYALSQQRGRTPAKLAGTLAAVVRRLRVVAGWRRHDIVYLQRELLPFGPPVVERWLKVRGARLLFDYDDALFIAKPSRFTPLATLLRKPGKTLELFRLADCVVAGNDWLRDRAQAEGGRAVTIEVAEDCTRFAGKGADPHRPVTVGWLGSASTAKYLHLIAPALRSVARARPDLRWEAMGSGAFAMDGVPWVVSDWSLSAEVAALERFDIGLMPLPDEDWAKGKSGGKARTYMAAGVVPVVSAIGYNRELIDHGRTGLLCQDPEDFADAILRLADDAAARRTMAEAARAEVARRFDPARQAARLKAVFDEVLER